MASRIVAPNGAAPETSPVQQVTNQPAERELKIQIWQDEYAEFEGTAAQLVAEGLIPDGFKWPRAAADVRWEANGFSYWLRRTRPEGHKGPMRSWLGMDHWFVRVYVTGRDREWHANREVQLKAEELRAVIRSHTVEGEREERANSARYWKAHDDKAFQAFKRLIPGLVPPKRGRKPKSSAT